MKILLDTHALLWYQDDSDKLSKKVKSLIRDEDNDVFVSIVSIWEIAIKSNLGKLALDFELTELKHMLKEYNFEILDLSIQQIEYLSTFSKHHKDPFDHLLIAQAILENLSLVSKDKQFKNYKELKILW
jgi:PIN domain nuclease of toxin-antitoxin system